MGKGLDKFIDIFRLKDDFDDYDDYDDYDDEYDEYDDVDDIPAPVVKKKIFKKETTEPKETKKETKSFVKKPVKKEPVVKSTKTVSEHKTESRNKIVPLKNAASRGEVCVLRPQVFDDSKAIVDVLLTGRAAVVNLEGIDLVIAQRIIDFICGSCYAMGGNIESISNYIFIVTPESIDISGDLQEVISSGIRIPSFNDYF